jgi:hypothetical protein
MYHWDQPEPPARRPASRIPHPRRPAGGTPDPGPAQAVQMALDRRDNGGDSGASRDQ